MLVVAWVISHFNPTPPNPLPSPLLLCTHTPTPLNPYTHLVNELVEGVLPVGAGLPEVHFPRLEAQLPVWWAWGPEWD